jgi:hypothetical protein
MFDFCYILDSQMWEGVWQLIEDFLLMKWVKQICILDTKVASCLFTNRKDIHSIINLKKESKSSLHELFTYNFENKEWSIGWQNSFQNLP